MKLSDEAIIVIARQLQIAILTGTDVVDNLRLIDLESSGDELVPTASSVQAHEDQIQSMLDLMESGQLSLDEGEGQIVS